MTRQQRRSRTLDDPRFEPFRNPRSRRRLAIGLIATLAIEGLILALTQVGPSTGVLIAGIAIVIVAGVFFLSALKASTRGLEELSEEVLDERQAQLRGQVHTTAYRVGSALFVTGLAVAALWTMLDWPAPGDGIVIAALLVSFHTSICLPTLVAALRADI
jgi:hypothetical protein